MLECLFARALLVLVVAVVVAVVAVVVVAVVVVEPPAQPRPYHLLVPLPRYFDRTLCWVVDDTCNAEKRYSTCLISPWGSKNTQQCDSSSLLNFISNSDKIKRLKQMSMDA